MLSNRQSTNSAHEELFQKVKEAVASTQNPLAIDILRQLNTYRELINAHPEWSSPYMDLQLLKLELSSRGLHCRDRFLENAIQDGDVIEVYDTTHRQIYRNFSFFLLSSYSVVAMVTSAWPELFERSPEIMESLGRDLNALWQEDGTKPYIAQTPAHIFKERAGSQFQFSAKIKFGWVLFNDDGERAGYLLTQSAVRDKNLENVATL